MRDPFHFQIFSTGRWATVLFSLFATGFAQSSSTRPSSADQAWTNVGVLARAAAETKVTKIGIVAANRDEANKGKDEREQRARKFRATAQNAKEFCAQYPTHPKAAEARKLEALAGLQGITPTDKVRERAAVATAATFRANKTNPPSARFEVAHAMERREIGKKIPGRPWFTHAPLAETMLDRLHTEFGDLPEVWGSYLALAHSTDCDNGRDVALRIVQSPTAPDPTKVAARRLLERYALVRKPLDFPLRPAEGRATTLGQLAGKVTVVCVWDGKRHPQGPPGLHDYKKNPSPNTRWVYVSIGTPSPLPRGTKPYATPPGTTCVEPLGWKSPLATKLLLTELPYAFVLDENKNLSGYGRIEELPALIKGIGRPVLP